MGLGVPVDEEPVERAMADRRGEVHDMAMTGFRMIRSAARWVAARLDVRSELGASAVEYGIMVMLIASVIIVAVFFLGAQTSKSFSCSAATIKQTGAASCG